MKDVYLDIKGEKLELSYPLLEIITRQLGDEEYHAPMVKAILALNTPSLTRHLVDNKNLSFEDLDKIWAQASIDLKLAMLSEINFMDNLSDVQAREIMAADNPEMLMKIASNAERLYPDNDGDHANRISGQTADELLQMIAHHPDKRVRLELAENRSAPAKFKPEIDLGSISTDLPGSYVRLITAACVKNFKNHNVDVLITIAENIEDITDKKAQIEIGDYLVKYPDPAVRLALAQNWSTPKRLLEILSHDEEAAIAAAAEENLE